MINNKNVDWPAMSVEDIIRAVRTDGEQGLTSEEARRRLERYGRNELVEEKKTSPLAMFLQQFSNILIIILLAATVVSAILGETLDAVIIFMIVLACALLGFFQEFRAEKAMAALKKMAALTAPVIRAGEKINVPAAEIVPGDVVLLVTGEKVPADGRVLEQVNLWRRRL
jgi:Ca2+-transporting ATPase